MNGSKKKGKKPDWETKMEEQKRPSKWSALSQSLAFSSPHEGEKD